MLRRSRIAPLLLLLLIAREGRATAREGEPGGEGSRWEWSAVERVVAVGDLHGSPDKFVGLLQGAGLLDADLRWAGGTDHLVIAGDVLDRGAGDRRLLDLLQRLEQESEAAGGRIHVLLGNHEVMNLMRDTRKVNPESYRDFALDETAAERRAAWTEFSRRGRATTRVSELGIDFHRRFPKGFFARRRMFDAEGRYGRWLLSLPTIVKVNDVVYVHGGLTDESAELGIDGINRGVTEALTRHLGARAVLERARLVNRAMELSELRAAVDEILKLPVVEAEVRAAAKAFVATQEDPLLSGGGPLWYRGLSFEDERIERRMLGRALALVDARAMVVAHSYTGGNRITSRFHGRLFRLDHGILLSERPLALVVERGEPLVLDPRNNHKTRPVRELPPGGVSAREAEVVSDLEQERFLSKARVVDSRDLGRGSTRPRLLRLEMNGDSRRGIFKTVDEPTESARAGGADRFQHEVAAYRIDRMIGLGMVPVTVIREVDGDRGSLQLWVEEAVDQADVSSYGLEFWEAETTAAQLARSRVFDALIGNADRQPTDILSSVRGSGIYLIDHSKAFPASGELPEGAAEPLAVPAALATALARLSREVVAAELGDLLTGPELDALLERKERILGLAAMASAPAELPDEPGGRRR